MDLQLRKIIDTERFGQLPQKVWLAECTTVAYEPEIKQYFKQESFCLESKQLCGMPLFKKRKSHIVPACSKWVFPLHQEPLALHHFGMSDNVLLDSSSTPQVCLGGRHPLSCSSLGQTPAFPSLPEMLMWAEIRARVRHRAAYKHMLPPFSKHTGPSFHPSPTFLSPGGLNKQDAEEHIPPALTSVEGNKEE